MAKLMVLGEIPDELLEQWMLHIQVFDRAHPGCGFAMLCGSELSTDKLTAMVEGMGLTILSTTETRDKPKPN